MISIRIFLLQDGIFDSKAFSGKDRSKLKVKLEVIRAEFPIQSTSTSATAAPITKLATSAGPDLAALVDIKMEEVDPVISASSAPSSSRSSKHAARDALAEKRYELFNLGSESRTLVIKRYYTLLLPTLIEVYSASVDSQVRTKAVLGLMKIINFCDADSLSYILKASSFCTSFTGDV